MLQRRVSVCPASGQPLFALVLACLSCILSMWLTLRFCRQLWPEEGSALLVALGLVWELAKLRFAPAGVRGLAQGPLVHRLGAVALVAMTVVLMAGSVVASIACLQRSDA